MKLYPNLKNLANYSPENSFTTTAQEADIIRKTLKFNEATEDDLYNYRTLVVVMWSSRYKDAKTEDGTAPRLWNAMNSITAVIDAELAKRH